MSEQQDQAGPSNFTFVNQTGPPTGKKADEEDLSIIRSHAMRRVHHKRRSSPPKNIQTQIARPALSTDWENLALGQFFDNFVSPHQATRINAFPYLDFLPSIYNRDAQNSPLNHIVLAVALAHFANQKSSQEIHLKARRLYARSLSSVIQSLKSPAAMASDEVLATLCLLTKYELVTGDEGNSTHLHDKGQIAMINHRGAAQLETEAGASLFRLVWIRQHLNCIANSELPPVQPAFEWNAAFASPSLQQLTQLVSRVAIVRYDSRQLTSADHDDASEVQMLQVVQTLDDDMQKFRQSLPPEFQHWTIPSCEVLPAKTPASQEGKYFPERVHLFENLQRASLWHIYCYCQMHLLRTLIQHTLSVNLRRQHALTQAQEESSAPIDTLALANADLAIERLRLRLRLTVDDVCASVPYLLGWSDDARFLNTGWRGRGVACHYSIWALAAILSVTEIEIPVIQREWVRDRLNEIGLVHGVRHALHFA